MFTRPVIPLAQALAPLRARPCARLVPRMSTLWMALLAWMVLAFSPTAPAATCAPASTPGTAPADWATYCWLDFSTYDDTLARAGGQSFVFNLSDGSKLTFVATVTAASTSTLKAVPAPAWTGAAVGNTAFLGIPGKPILYTAKSGKVTVTFSAITLTPPPGITGGSTYSFVSADGESTNGGESLAFTTNGGNWILLDQVPPISGSTYPTAANSGATFTETGAGGLVGGYIVGSLNPTQVSTTMVAGGLQGAMFALRYSTISLNKTLSAGRVDPTDQFTYRISATSSGTVLGNATSSGSGNGPFSPTSSFLTTQQSLTLSEVMAPGSASPLSSYVPSLTCVNTASGSTTVLPTNAASTSYVIPSISFGDSIACDFTNAKGATLLGIAKSAPAPALKVGVNSVYTLTVTNSGAAASPAAQVKDQLPANLTFISATGTNWTCANVAALLTCDFSGGTIAASGGTSTISVTLGAPIATGGASITNYASVDPAGGASAPAPGAMCAPAAACASSGPYTVIYINPQPESGTSSAGTASTPIATVTANDLVNAAAATLGPGGNATVSQSGTWPAGVTLDPSSGAINTTAALAPGVYSLAYQLCDRDTPVDCATVTDTLTVKASILPVAEAGTAVAGTASTPIASVVTNDLVNGAPATLGASGDATISPSGTWPAGLTLNTGTGAITTSAALAPGSYAVVYQLCDRNTPANCATTTDTVTLSGNIMPANPSGTTIAGTAGTPIPDVASGGRVNGAPATLGSGGNAIVTTVGSWPPGVTLDPTTGAISTTAAVPPGTYSLIYQLCDRGTPANCGSATATVKVTALIAAVSESGTAVAGIASTAIANVAANDHVNGAAAALGPAGNATVARSGTWPAGLTLNTVTGSIDFAATVPPGTYSLVYQLCDRNTPANCATVTDAIVASGSAIPAPVKGAAIAGIASTPISSIVSGSTVNGSPATLGSAGNSSVAPSGAWPAGLSLNAQTGAVTTTADLPEGTYTLAFRLCNKSTPQACANSTAAVTVTALLGGALFLEKTASTTRAEIGQSVQYRLRLRNSGGNPVTDVKLADTLPLGFKLIPGSVRIGLEPSQPTQAADPPGTPGPALNFPLGVIAPGAVLDIYYQVRVGVGAERGEGINRAQARGVGAQSGVAFARVLIIAGGVFDVSACVVGKIYVDCNGNRLQDPGEPGIPGVRVYFEDGTNLTTDENGAYSLCGLRPLTHVIKVDRTTLPAGSRLVVLSSRNAGDGDTLFADLRDGELRRADFAEGSCTDKVMEEVKRRHLPAVLAPLPPAGREHIGVEFESNEPAGTAHPARAPAADPAARP